MGLPVLRRAMSLSGPTENRSNACCDSRYWGDERTWLDCIENEVDDPIARSRLGVIWSKAAKERDRERSDANSAGLVGLEPRGCPAHARAQRRLDSKQPSRRMPL